MDYCSAQIAREIDGSMETADIDTAQRDATLVTERARIILLLSALANALGTLPVEQLADVLPMVGPLDSIVRRIRQHGVVVPVPYDHADRT